jgi:signal transduction histidine kinase/CheY-like chemotaxis protein
MRHLLHILSIEDDPKDAELIQDLLETEGLACELTRVETQAALLASVEKGGIDLILADYSLPSFDGISALKFAMKACPDVPFIFVSGTLGEEVAIEALKIGATDYVLKTSLSRLVPSVLRALREATQKTERRRAEEALRQSETYLAEAQRLSHTGSFGWRPSTGEIIWSEETFRIFQYDRTTKPTVELVLQRVHPEDAASVKQTIERASQDGKDFDHQYRLVMPDGAVKHVHVVAYAERDKSGELEFVGAVMDATESKRAEKELRRSEESLLEAQKLSHTGSWRHDVVSGTVTVSPEIYRIHDVRPDDDASNTGFFFGRFHPEDRKRVVDLFERSELEKAEFQVDYRIVLPDGTIKHLHTTGHPILNESCNLVEFVGTAIDVTAAKQAEEALRRSEGYLADAQRLTRTGSWAWNVATRQSVYWSQENYRLFAFDPEGGIPSDQVFYQRIHPEDRDRVGREVFLERPEEGSHFDVEFRIVLPGGAMKYIRSTGHPVRNTSGVLLEYVGTSIDVTERKRADEERERLRQAQADLAHLSRVTTMGELTASLAHEVNQPIAAAITNANTCLRWLARDHPDLEEARAAAMRIVKDSTRAAEIIKRTRLLFKKDTPDRELVDINELVREMIVLLRNEAMRYNVVVRTELATDLPQVMGDRVQLQQVLMNLMINAIDAMKDMDDTRKLIIESERAENEQLLVSVSDTGIGLPSETDHLFNAFFTTKPHGTGMGLRISRSIIESHGGRLWAAGNSPRGASFCFTLATKAQAHE